jgi:hypothetical protein
MSGLAIGLVVSSYHARNWDWQTRTWRDQRRTVTSVETLGILVPLAVAAGGLTARYGLIEHLFGKRLNDFLFVFGMNGFGFFLTYLALQDWRFSSRTK